MNIQRGYCGLKCGECPAHIAMETDDDALRAKTAAEWNAQHGSEMKPEEIDPEAPLFGEGLGLDSIDALEIALAVSRRYGFQLRSDDERNGQIFASLRNLAAHIDKNRVQ